MTNKEHLELSLKLLKSDRAEIDNWNDPSICETPCFSAVIIEIVDLELKRLETELLEDKA
jgi:hypothetical protein